LRRVAITGTGVVSPIGCGTDAFFDGLIAPRSGVRRIDIPDVGRLRARIAAQIGDFDPQAHFAKEKLRQLDRFSQFAIVAAREAWKEAALPEDLAAECGTYFGTGLGGAGTLEVGYDDLFRKNLDRVKPLSVIAAMPNSAAANIAIEFGLRGPCYTYAVACASSAVAIGEAYRAVSAGWLKAALAGGSEALLCFGIIKGWEALMTLAIEDKDAPESSCRPFARDRTGFVLGEGAGALVIEDLDQAKHRGAPILAELVGYGITNDAGHLSRPSPEGQVAAMRTALDEAQKRGISPNDIGYLNAHGTATKLGDKIESESIKMAFGDRAKALPVSSTKAVHGHLLGAGGAVELIGAIVAMRRGILPPTAHLHEPDPELNLDFVPLVARRVSRIRAVMSNSFAFGGTNAALVAASAS
jgi:3-oxoacyl-[acyl-carrier-protein] synthase II